MKLKLWFSFLFLYGIHDVQCSRGFWTANVPTKISALQGSCVVIPCTYTYPKPNSKKILNRWNGFWRTGNKIVAANLPKWKLNKEYKKRTQFLGNLQAHNCTMVLYGIRKTDVGPFYFRIEMPQYKSFSYTNNTVSIDVLLSHSCPSNPPNFSWSRSGTVTHRSKRVDKGKWEAVSTLTFHPQPSDFNKRLNCTVLYRGGRQATNSTILFT
ncbi:hypothetical protein PAMA_014992 [Pampus argenteus]